MDSAFSALPSVISELPAPTQLLKSRRKAYGYLFRTAESLLPVLETENSRRPGIFILTGERQSGKTTFLIELIRIIREKGFNPRGFISEGVHEGENRIGFNLTDISTGSKIELCNMVERPGMIKQGRFWFSREALDTGEEILRQAVSSKAEVIVIDEVGHLEISGKGWYDAIESATATSDAVHIWTVRKSLINKAARRWNTGNVTVVDTNTALPDEIAVLITDAAREA